jgi:hypothetical protein
MISNAIRSFFDSFKTKVKTVEATSTKIASSPTTTSITTIMQQTMFFLQVEKTKQDNNSIIKIMEA